MSMVPTRVSIGWYLVAHMSPDCNGILQGRNVVGLGPGVQLTSSIALEVPYL